MVFIEDYIQDKIESGLLTKEIAKELNITSAMVGQYKLRHGYRPSLTVAKKAYENDGVVLHPFSEESLKWELENELH